MGIMTYRRMREREALKKDKEALNNGENETDTRDDGAGADGTGATGNDGNDGAGTNGAGNTDGAAGVAGAADSAGESTGTEGEDAGTPGDSTGSSEKPDSTPGAGVNEVDVHHVTPAYSAEQYSEIMKNKGNVMAELKKQGVEFSDRTGADELRDMLNAALAEKGLLPDGN